jgi:benzoylformate decarboxylase
MYSLQALWTAAQHNLPLVCVVLNNSQYGILKSFAAFERLAGSLPGLDVPGLDLVALAQGLGCAATHVDTLDVLTPALHAAFASKGPILLDIRIDATVGQLVGIADPG